MSNEQGGAKAAGPSHPSIPSSADTRAIAQPRVRLPWQEGEAGSVGVMREPHCAQGYVYSAETHRCVRRRRA